MVERNGVDPKVVDFGSRYVGLEDIAADGSISVGDVEATELSSTKFRFDDRHVLFGKLRPYLRKVSRPHFSGICSTDILPIAAGHRLDRSYLFHFLRTDWVIDKATLLSSGANLPRISPQHLVEFEIPLPPLGEQRRIAAILDHADSLRRKRLLQLEMVSDLPGRLFDAMFGSDPSLPRASLSSLCDLITDGTHYTPRYADRGVIFLSARNVTSGRVNWDNVKYIPSQLHLELQRRVSPRIGDVLMAKNGTTGVAAIVDREEIFDIYVSLALLRPGGNILGEYLCCALNSQSSKRQFNYALKGIGVSNLHLVDIRKAMIPLPSVSAQATFTQGLGEINRLRSRLEGGLKASTALFASLQDRAFRGEL
ncbi:MAG: restriction endonuclease subunit S [Caulobacteraceae bacterium]